MAEHILPADIERSSMAIIQEELDRKGIVLPVENRAVILRVIHTTADFDYVESLQFTEKAVERGIAALRTGAAVITDTNMARAGINSHGLEKLNGSVHCYMADPDVAEEAKERMVTRAAVSMERAALRYAAAVFAVGNAPTALLKVCELIENGLRPSLVIGVPVGFVNVVESKRRIFEVCRKFDVPCIAAMGRKGGSNVAAAVCNALIYSALGVLDPAERQVRFG